MVPIVTTKGVVRTKGVDSANAICEFFFKVGENNESVINSENISNISENENKDI